MADHVDKGVTVTFDAAVFDIEAVKRAAYRFSDRLVVAIAISGGNISCDLQRLRVGDLGDPADLVSEFRNEVLDQDLRLKIAAETEGYRNLVLSLAFSKTPLGR